MEIIELSIKDIRKNPYQPRQTFDEEKLEDLKNSILIHGVMQPVTVRKSVKGYTLVAGERRLRASKRAGLLKIPAIITEMSDREMMELAIIENLQREDLSALEEAESYKELMTKAKLTQDELSQRLGKSRSYIANMLRLLNLPLMVKRAMNEQKLSSAHGRTLLSLKEPLLMEQVAREAIDKNMSVRALEAYVKTFDKKRTIKKTSKKLKFLQGYENQLKEHYGTNVEIKKVKNKGMIQLEFTSEEEFKRILRMLQKK
ncbi:ParB/RepB/Spo0J family partition protein [Jeotgalicoccus psychrophilus]|uniref:ParB/RepB/Spo0J family partition protein n=1 Tax=Jeotgalicoccus psychrophilus TaxID=157228 RepID=UPI00042A580F|nr:ParB/RepB/Spo0J family partition protein [Jeotgalicoccus psychrophilus]